MTSIAHVTSIQWKNSCHGHLFTFLCKALVISWTTLFISLQRKVENMLHLDASKARFTLMDICRHLIVSLEKSSGRSSRK
jgi:hypothetical protein